MKQNAYKTFINLMKIKVVTAKQNHSIHELNDCNNKIINLINKNEIKENQCIHLIGYVYQYAPDFKPTNGDQLKESLKKLNYHLALKALNSNYNKVFTDKKNFMQGAKFYCRKILGYCKFQ